MAIVNYRLPALNLVATGSGHQPAIDYQWSAANLTDSRQ